MFSLTGGLPVLQLLPRATPSQVWLTVAGQTEGIGRVASKVLVILLLYRGQVPGGGSHG